MGEQLLRPCGYHFDGRPGLCADLQPRWCQHQVRNGHWHWHHRPHGFQWHRLGIEQHYQDLVFPDASVGGAVLHHRHRRQWEPQKVLCGECHRRRCLGQPDPRLVLLPGARDLPERQVCGGLGPRRRQPHTRLRQHRPQCQPGVGHADRRHGALHRQCDGDDEGFGRQHHRQDAGRQHRRLQVHRQTLGVLPLV